MKDKYIRIRKNESEIFPLPLSSRLYAILVYLDNQNLLDEEYWNEQELIERCDYLINNKIPFKIYGIWHGQWRTDVFDLDYNKLKNRIKK